MKTEIIYDMAETAYRVMPALSQTTLKVYGKTPAHGRAYELGLLKVESSAFDFGKVVHSAVLERDKYLETCVVAPEMMPDAKGVMKPTNGNMTSYKEWVKGCAGKTIVTKEETDAIKVILENIQNHPVTKSLFENGKSEVSAFASMDDVDCRARFDFVPESEADRFCLVDVKTCERADKDSFQRSIIDYGYHIQAAFYLWMSEAVGLDRGQFTFVCIEKTPPYAIAVYTLDNDSLLLGQRKVRELLSVYRECAKNQNWPAYSEDVQEIGVPDWVKKMEGLQ